MRSRYRQVVTQWRQRICGSINTYPISSLTACFVIWKLILVLVIITSPGPGYDTSTTLLTSPVPKSGEIRETPASPFKSPLLRLSLLKFIRWDAIYFIRIAERGYLFEQEWAFGWGYTRLLSTLSSAFIAPGPRTMQTALVAIGISHLSHFLSVLSLYGLTKRIFGKGEVDSELFYFLSAVFHIICPAGAFLAAPYGESVFSFLNFTGFYLYSSALRDDSRGYSLGRDLKFLVAGGIFAAAATVRSNGILSGILFAYDALLALKNTVLDGFTVVVLRRLFFLVLGGTLVAVGIIWPQSLAYTHYCVSTGLRRDWCGKTVPSIYTWVQSHYWNVGFLQYWTFSNLPLFCLATPMLIILCRSSIWALNFPTGSVEESQSEENAVREGHRRACLSRLAIPQAALTILAFTSYHVQIITRISSGYPVWYWFLAAEILREGKSGTADAIYLSPGKMVRGMVLYGLVQGALFASFLPPA